MLFRLRLGHIINTLPRYDNKFKRDPYKNGNIARVTMATKNHNGEDAVMILMICQESSLKLLGILNQLNLMSRVLIAAMLIVV